MTQNVVPKMATINEASRITGLAKYFIRQLAITGKIKTIKAGKKYLINVNKLIEFLDGEEKTTEATPQIKKIEK